MDEVAEFRKAIFSPFRRASESIMKRIMVRVLDEEGKIRFESRLPDSMNTAFLI